MASTNSAVYSTKFGTQANIVGPVHRDDPAPSQSLLDRHHKLSANYNLRKEELTQNGADDPRQDRILGGGARTPRSLCSQIQRQVEHNEATK